MNWDRKIAWIGIVLVGAVAVTLTFGYLVFRSLAFQRYLRTQIEKEASQATGARIEIRQLELHLWASSAEASGITVHGDESADVRPLAQADRLIVCVKIASLLHRKVELSEIVLHRPIVNLILNKDGRTNLPAAPKSNTQSSSNLFDLGIQHILLDKGEVYYNDVKTPLDADLHDLHFEIRSELIHQRYDGTFSYSNGHLQYGDMKPLPHDLSAEFQANPSELTLKSLVLRITSATVQFQGQLQNYAAPSIQGSYRIVFRPEDMRPVLESVAASHRDFVPAGELTVAGSLKYKHQENIPVIRRLVIDGDLTSSRLRIDNDNVRSEINKANGEFHLASGDLSVPRFEVDLLGGHLSGAATIHNIDVANSAGTVRASLQGISLDQINATAKAANLNQVPVHGRLNGTAEALWTAGFKTAKARSDVQVKGSLTTASSGSKPIPLDGAFHVAYDAHSGLATLTNTYLGTPMTRIGLTGTAGPNVDLKLHAQAGDLREVDSLVASFQNFGALKPTDPERRESINLGGTADLQLSVEGRSNDPRIAGKLNGQNLQIENTEWRSLTLELHANKSSVTIANGSLVNRQQGYVHFSASSGVSNWRYLPTSPTALEVNSQGLAIASLLRLARINYPVQGDLSMNVSMRGSQMDPHGSGSIRLMHAKVYGQSVQQTELHFSGDGNTLTSTLDVTTTAGSLKSQLAYHPKTKAYEFQLDAPGIQLAQLQPLQEKNIGIGGVLAMSAYGKGTIDDPQLTSTVQIAQLKIRETRISGVKANLNVANHKANATLDSEVAQTLLQARAVLDLSGEYYLHANFDTKDIPIEGLLAMYTPVRSNGPHGIVEVHASVDGPLSDMNRIEAQLVIPTLNADYQGLQIGNAKPIQIDYANSIVAVHPTELTGTDTNLRIEGQVPVRGNAPTTLAANGSIDLRLLQFFQHDLQSSGKLQLDLRGTGPTTHPTVAGQIHLQNVAVNSPDAPVGVQNVNGLLDVGSDRVNITELTGEAGGGKITANGSVGYRPPGQMNVALQAKNVRIRYQDQIRTVLEGNLSLVGTTQAATLTGRVLINSLSFTPNFDLATLAGQVESGPESTSEIGTTNNVKLDITVQTSREMNLTSSAVSLQGQANLRVIGTAADPVIVGRTEFTGGDIFLMNQRYRIERGIIEFPNPHRTEPVLNVLLTSTINQYNLSLTFRGPIAKLQTSYVSDPPLATADIINLIARGQTTGQAAAAPSNLGATSLLAQGAASQASGQIQKLAGLSSLSIDPTLGGNNTDPGARIAMQKRVTNNLVFTFATDVTSEQREIIQGEYKINKGWSTSVTRDENGGFAVDGKYHKRF
jgi:translocation and assembly module TamB